MSPFKCIEMIVQKKGAGKPPSGSSTEYYSTGYLIFCSPVEVYIWLVAIVHIFVFGSYGVRVEKIMVEHLKYLNKPKSVDRYSIKRHLVILLVLLY